MCVKGTCHSVHEPTQLETKYQHTHPHEYPTGDFDTCEEKASALYMCLSNKIKKDPHIQEASARGSWYIHVLVIVDIRPNDPYPQPTKHLPIHIHMYSTRNSHLPLRSHNPKTENPAEAPAPAHLGAGGARSTGPVAGVGAEGAAGVVLKGGGKGRDRYVN